MPTTPWGVLLVVIFVIDVALGAAFLKTVAKYRKRIEILYNLNGEGRSDEADEPVGVRDRAKRPGN